VSGLRPGFGSGVTAAGVATTGVANSRSSVTPSPGGKSRHVSRYGSSPKKRTHSLALKFLLARAHGLDPP